MSAGDELRRENAALRARFDALGEASLRIGASLDHDQRLVTVAGRTVELAPTEYEFLRSLSLDAGCKVILQAKRVRA